MDIITSRTNSTVKALVSLKQKKFLDESSFFLVEGEKIINEIPEGFVEKYVVSESYIKNNALEENIETIAVADNVFEQISNNRTPQGRIALCKKLPTVRLKDLLSDKLLVIMCENINNPGNLGTIIRSAYSFAADALIIGRNSVSVYNPKTLQSTGGAVFRLPLIEDADFSAVIPELKENGVNIVAATVGENAKTPRELDFTCAAIIVGNESGGITKETLALAQEFVKIPMPGGGESLNLSVAASILLYESAVNRK
ncbi:rRNA methyltransferase [Clostridia bacterium]|nr:rRNA methyltransferase [Clostridia bacterium]